jgi:hypothetical protein
MRYAVAFGMVSIGLLKAIVVPSLDFRRISGTAYGRPGRPTAIDRRGPLDAAIRPRLRRRGQDC